MMVISEGGRVYDMRKRKFGDTPVDKMARKLAKTFPDYEITIINTLLRANYFLKGEDRKSKLCWCATLEHKVDKTTRLLGSFDRLSDCLYRGYSVKTQPGFEVEIVVYANEVEEKT